jgi:hypothetical protein
MTSPDELAEDPESLPTLRQGDEQGVRPVKNSLIRVAAVKYAYMENRWVQAGNNLARIAHLRIELIRIREAVR